MRSSQAGSGWSVSGFCVRAAQSFYRSRVLFQRKDTHEKQPYTRLPPRAEEQNTVYQFRSAAVVVVSRYLYKIQNKMRTMILHVCFAGYQPNSFSLSSAQAQVHHLPRTPLPQFSGSSSGGGIEDFIKDSMCIWSWIGISNSHWHCFWNVQLAGWLSVGGSLGDLSGSCRTLLTVCRDIQAAAVGEQREWIRDWAKIVQLDGCFAARGRFVSSSASGFTAPRSC